MQVRISESRSEKYSLTVPTLVIGIEKKTTDGRTVSQKRSFGTDIVREQEV